MNAHPTARLSCGHFIILDGGIEDAKHVIMHMVKKHGMTMEEVVDAFMVVLRGSG